MFPLSYTGVDKSHKQVCKQQQQQKKQQTNKQLECASFHFRFKPERTRKNTLPVIEGLMHSTILLQSFYSYQV